MASLTVSEAPFEGYANQAHLGCNDYVNNGFWTQRFVQNGFSYFSSAQVEVISWRLFGTAALLGAVTLVGLAAFEIVALPAALYAIPTLILSSYFFWYSNTIDDHESKEQMAQIRVQAQGMTLNEVAERFEWPKIFQNRILSPSQFANLYRRQVLLMSVNELVSYYEKVSRHADPFNEASGFSYAVPLPREHAAKWRSETQNKTFKEIITEYSLEKLERLGLIDYSEMQKIRELLAIHHFAETGYHFQQELANQEFEEAIASFRQTYNQSLQAIEDGYNANEAVQAGLRFQNTELLARLEIENESTRRLHEAREQHEQRIALINPYGRLIAKESLTPENRVLYDRSLLQLHQNEQVVAQDLQQRLLQHNAEFSRQRAGLDAEIAREREMCDRLKVSSQERFRLGSEPGLRARQQRLQPHLEQFQRILDDLNRIYQAYLRQLRTVR